MIKRSLSFVKIIMFIALVSLSFQGYASLGKMRVLSGFGSTLNVEILLTGSTGIEFNTIRVGELVDGKFLEFKKSSVTKVGHLHLHILNRGKSRFLVIKSTGQVKEPVFSFAVQSLHGDDNIVREYNVVMYPSGYTAPVSLYHRYSNYEDAWPNEHNVWRLVAVVLNKSAISSTPKNVESPTLPVDKTIVDLEKKVKEREDAINAHEKKLDDLAKKFQELLDRENKINRTPIQRPIPIKNKSTPDFSLPGGDYKIALGLLLIIFLVSFFVFQFKRRNRNNSMVDGSNLKFDKASSSAEQFTNSNLSNSEPSISANIGFTSGVEQRQASAQATFMTDFTQMSGAIDTGEVDPIAEAEVYIAYGRDAQAEDILMDALKQDPSRHEVRMKLMELYSSKSDKTRFERLAREIYQAFDGRGVLWAKSSAMGLAIDPLNPLYKQSSEVSVLHPIQSTSLPIGSGNFISLDDELDIHDSSVKQENLFVEKETLNEEDDSDLLSALFNDIGSEVDEETLDGTLSDSVRPMVASVPFGVIGTSSVDNLAEEDFLEFDISSDKTLTKVEPKLSDASGENIFSDFFVPIKVVQKDVVSAIKKDKDELLLSKIDLAKVYLDMGDKNGAREVLLELVAQVSDDGSLRDQAMSMLKQIEA